MLDLTHEWRRLCREHRAGSRATQADRLAMAVTISSDLDEVGYHRFVRQRGCAHRLRDRHVRALVAHWQNAGTSPRTIENRLSFLRTVSRWTGRAGLMEKSSRAYGVPATSRTAQDDKSVRVGPEVLARVDNAFARASLRLQQAGGLRREEALKVVLAQADKGNRLVLQDSWCKGKREREIPMTPALRAAVDEARAVAGTGSLIPAAMSYQAYRDGPFRVACESVGLNRTHGLRHAWAQDQYLALTGWECPVRGGPSRDQLTPEQLRADRAARSEVSAGLGHERRSVTNAYLGR